MDVETEALHSVYMQIEQCFENNNSTGISNTHFLYGIGLWLELQASLRFKREDVQEMLDLTQHNLVNSPHWHQESKQ